MLIDATNREFDVVVTHSLDRLSRNLIVTLNAFHTFASNGVTYVSATQEIDYSTPEGKLFMTMVAAFAQYFSDNLSGHTKKGLRERVRQGLFNGEPPFRYQRCDPECLGLDESHTGCHPDPETAQIVAELFERYANGSHSQATLAQWMNRQEFKTSAREPDECSQDPDGIKGRRFTGFSIRDILKNPFYTGKVRHKQEQFDGRHQPIVDQLLFDAVQKRKKENRSRKTAMVNRLSKNPHMLTGLLRCHKCGTKLWSQRQGNRGGTYYKVPHKGLEHPCQHTGKVFNGQVIEDQASLIFADFTLRDNWVDWIIENYVNKSDLAEGLKRREALAQKIDRARELYLEGDLSKERYDLIKSNADAEIATLYIPELDDAVKASQLVTNLGTLWKEASAGQRNRLLRSVLDAIYVDLGSREVVGLHPKESFMALVLAMEERSGVTITANPDVENIRDGGDGGERAPLLPWYPIAVEFTNASEPGTGVRHLIKSARVRQGLSTSALAELLGVSARTVRSWELGNTVPKNRKLETVFAVLGEGAPGRRFQSMIRYYFPRCKTGRQLFFADLEQKAYASNPFHPVKKRNPKGE